MQTQEFTFCVKRIHPHSTATCPCVLDRLAGWLLSRYDRCAHHRADRFRFVDWQPGRRKFEYSPRVNSLLPWPRTPNNDAFASCSTPGRVVRPGRTKGTERRASASADRASHSAEAEHAPAARDRNGGSGVKESRDRREPRYYRTGS